MMYNMKKYAVIGFALGTMLLIQQKVNAQKKSLAECTIDFTVTVAGNTTNDAATESLKQSAVTVYLKNKQARMDITSPAIKISRIYHGKTGVLTILQESGNTKLMMPVDSLKQAQQIQKFATATVDFSQQETKVIIGYQCSKAIVTTLEGTIYTVFYVPNLIPVVTEYEPLFTKLPGLVLMYSTKQANKETVITFEAVKINYNPVAAARFDIPQTGYRVIH
jgi:hypothetical protein